MGSREGFFFAGGETWSDIIFFFKPKNPKKIFFILRHGTLKGEKKRGGKPFLQKNPVGGIKQKKKKKAIFFIRKGGAVKYFS